MPAHSVTLGMGSRLLMRGLLTVGLLATSAYGAEVPKLVPEKIGRVRPAHLCGNLFLTGQPSRDDLVTAKERGIRRVITLREPTEADWEAAAASDVGLDYYQVPFRAAQSLTADVFDEVRQLLRESDRPTLLHCGSANRVGAVWLAYRVLDQGVPLEEALSEAKQVGLQNPQYEARAVEYIARQSEARGDKTLPAEASVRPGINDNFLRPDLDVSEWLGRFEIESREVYTARQEVIAATGVQPGWNIADVGAGTGFFARLFAESVGETGWVFAVDISPAFLRHINERAEKEQVRNLTSVLASQRSIQLPPESLDLVFVCDTYHHFEYPQSTLASIHRALREGGSLVLIDFERIPGKTREFLLNHVRAGKPVFRGEVELAGFEFVEEVRIEAFQENYLLRFRKKSG